jgi:hypothetical protein
MTDHQYHHLGAFTGDPSPPLVPVRSEETNACYERIDNLVNAVNGLLGLLQLIEHRDDVSPELLEAIRSNHRVVYAVEAVS